MPTVRVVVSPTVWQKAIALLIALGCILLSANLIVTVLGLSSDGSRMSSACPRPVSLFSAERPTQ
ncbi:MAG: hypothetical protein AAFO83_05240 [Cyanobacteria bacterium J06607_13]